MTAATSLWTGFIVTLSSLFAIGVFFPLPFGILPPLLGLGFLVAARLKTGAWPKLDWPLYAWLAALTALAAASSLWSVTPDDSLERAIKVGLLLLFSLPLIDLARACPQDILLRWRMLAPAVICFGAAYCLTELQFDFPIHRLFGQEKPENVIWGSVLNKNVSIFIMALPAVLLLCHKAGTYTTSAVLLLLAGLIAMTTQSQAAQIALIVIPLAWAGVFILPATGIPIAFACAGLLIILMPWLSPIAFDMFAAEMNVEGSFAHKASASMRLENWDFISRKIMENPLTGFGMDATRSITDFQSEKIYFATSTIMHPHNISLQFWIEFGVPGIILLLGFLAFLLRRIMALPRPARRTPFVMFCGIMSFLMVSWSVWASWLLGLIVCLVALTVLAARTSNARAIS